MRDEGRDVGMDRAQHRGEGICGVKATRCPQNCPWLSWDVAPGRCGCPTALWVCPLSPPLWHQRCSRGIREGRGGAASCSGFALDLCRAGSACVRCHFSAVTSAGDTCGAAHGDNPTIPAQEFRQGHQQRWGPARAEPCGRRATVGSGSGEERPGKGTRLSGHIPEFPWMWQQGRPGRTSWSCWLEVHQEWDPCGSRDGVPGWRMPGGSSVW